MGEEINDDGKRRLDRIEEGLQMLAKGHLQFQQEYRKLIKGLALRALTRDRRPAEPD